MLELCACVYTYIYNLRGGYAWVSISFSSIPPPPQLLFCEIRGFPFNHRSKIENHMHADIIGEALVMVQISTIFCAPYEIPIFAVVQKCPKLVADQNL